MQSSVLLLGDGVGGGNGAKASVVVGLTENQWAFFPVFSSFVSQVEHQRFQLESWSQQH